MLLTTNSSDGYVDSISGIKVFNADKDKIPWYIKPDTSSSSNETTSNITSGEASSSKDIMSDYTRISIGISELKTM